MSSLAQSIAPRPAPAQPARAWSATRIVGHVLMAMWIIAGACLVYYLASNIFSPFVLKYWGKYLDGFIITLQIVFVSLGLGAALSVPIALARSSKTALFRWPAYGYVYFFRGTPLLAQTFLIYYGAGSFRAELTDVGLWWFFRDAWYCIIFAFTLNTSAYQAEILRGAVENVSKGQWEGGRALGLTKPVIFFKIILPQALMVALRP
ncbi:MAG: ABC transporter permease subunit, partial [Nisaea sp.]